MAIHGKGGNLDYGGADVANLKSFTMSRVDETADTTAMGDTWATFIPGLTDFTGSAEALSQTALDTPALMCASDSIIFSTAAGGAGYTSSVIVTGITETATVDDVLTVSYSYEGNSITVPTYGAATGTAPTASTGTIHGKNIKVVSGGTIADVIGWSITMTCPVSDATAARAPAVPTECGRLKLAGVPTATATVTIITPSTVIPVLEGSAAATLELWRTNTLGDGKYTGTALCTGSETSIDVTGTETTTMSFLYTGAVTLAVA